VRCGGPAHGCAQPAPSSRTARTNPFSRVVHTLTQLPAPAWRTAFAKRFCSARVNACSSPGTGGSAGSTCRRRSRYPEPSKWRDCGSASCRTAGRRPALVPPPRYPRSSPCARARDSPSRSDAPFARDRAHVARHLLGIVHDPVCRFSLATRRTARCSARAHRGDELRPLLAQPLAAPQQGDQQSAGGDKQERRYVPRRYGTTYGRRRGTPAGTARVRAVRHRYKVFSPPVIPTADGTTLSFCYTACR
jgi:hypothetical protein